MMEEWLDRLRLYDARINGLLTKMKVQPTTFQHLDDLAVDAVTIRNEAQEMWNTIHTMRLDYTFSDSEEKRWSTPRSSGD